MMSQMKYLSILLFITAVLAANPDDDDDIIDDRIVGGVEIKIVNRSCQVAVIPKGHICGGSVIHPLYILTAAHCTNTYNETDIKIRAGSNYYFTGGVVRGVEKIYQHEDFNAKTLINDVSVLKMFTELPLGSKISTIPLARNIPDIDTELIVSGYGRTTFGGITSNSLMQVSVHVVDFSDCNAAYKNNLTKEMQICASGEGKDSCQGDSGGPITWDDLLIGVVSFGNGCADVSYPGIYSSIPYFYDWIAQYVPLDV